jgi:hypothetical protein
MAADGGDCPKCVGCRSYNKFTSCDVLRIFRIKQAFINKYNTKIFLLPSLPLKVCSSSVHAESQFCI